MSEYQRGYHKQERLARINEIGILSPNLSQLVGTLKVKP
jgi:hypothetical protein